DIMTQPQMWRGVHPEGKTRRGRKRRDFSLCGNQRSVTNLEKNLIFLFEFLLSGVAGLGQKSPSLGDFRAFPMSFAEVVHIPTSDFCSSRPEESFLEWILKS
ncbi:MAG: hypothetical protein ACE5K2_03560, partial [Candidatus Zixiibacteriota bacterium]